MRQKSGSAASGCASHLSISVGVLAAWRLSGSPVPFINGWSFAFFS